MSLNLDLLEGVRVVHHGKITAACPVCRTDGRDSTGTHLVCYGEDGRGAFACIKGCDPKEIYALAGGETPDSTMPLSARELIPEHQTAKLPTFARPRPAELEHIASVRGWKSAGGLIELSARGLLKIGSVYDAGVYRDAWIITDSAKRNAQARRMDGRPWVGISSKAKTLPGVHDSRWPIGAADIGRRRTVVFCEGQPDFCASFIIAHSEGIPLDELAPVCMTGAGVAISSIALPLFRGKRILVPYHNEPSKVGRRAAEAWRDQLYSADAEAVVFLNFEALGAVPPIKDVADFAARGAFNRPIFAPAIAGAG